MSHMDLSKNQVLEVIDARRSIRKFEKTAISEDEIKALEMAALTAPTAMNRRELRFTFLHGEEKISALHEEVAAIMAESEGGRASLERLEERGAENVFYGAPLVILISGKETTWTSLDAGIAVQNLALAAESLGLGSCIIGMIRRAFKPNHPEGLDKKYHFEEGENFQISIAIGHKAMSKDAHEQEAEHIRHIK